MHKMDYVLMKIHFDLLMNPRLNACLRSYAPRAIGNLLAKRSGTNEMQLDGTIGKSEIGSI